MLFDVSMYLVLVLWALYTFPQPLAVVVVNVALMSLLATFHA